MIVAAHVVAGGVLGELVGDPVPAFVVGFMSHFILDAIPHYDTVDDGCYSKRQIVFTSIDFLVMFWLLFAVLKLPLDNSLWQSPLAWGALGGFFPDFVDNVPFWSKWFRASKYGKSFHYFHDLVHKKQPSFLTGMTVQAITIILFLLVYFDTI